MKKLICMILAICMACSLSSVLAESAAGTDTGSDEPVVFNASMLEGLDGYSYDPFEKKWEYATACSYTVDHNTSAYVILYTQSYSLDSVDGFLIMFDLRRSGTTQQLEYATILIGTDVYRFGYLMAGEIGALDANSVELFQALANADSIQVRFATGSRNYDFTLDGENYATTIKAYCQAVIDTNMLSVTPTLNSQNRQFTYERR